MRQIESILSAALFCFGIWGVISLAFLFGRGATARTNTAIACIAGIPGTALIALLFSLAVPYRSDALEISIGLWLVIFVAYCRGLYFARKQRWRVAQSRFSD